MVFQESAFTQILSSGNLDSMTLVAVRYSRDGSPMAPPHGFLFHKFDTEAPHMTIFSFSEVSSLSTTMPL